MCLHVAYFDFTAIFEIDTIILNFQREDMKDREEMGLSQDFTGNS